MSSKNIFDTYPVAAKPGTVVPATLPARPNEYTFKRDWYIDQVYDPDIHSVDDVWVKYIVPYEGELVKDISNKLLYVVSHVDTSTWKSTLVPFSYVSNGGEQSEYPLFPQHEYGMLQGELPLLVDYSVSPPYARASAIAYAANPSYALLFEGSSILDGQKPISAVYANQDLVTDKIGVATVMPAGFNVEQDILKATTAFSVTLPKETLKNGTRTTLVYYDENKNPICSYSLMTQHCEYMRDRRLSRRFVKNIELVAPWFTNSSTPNTMYIPVNLALSSIEFTAKVYYSDGDVESYPVNGYDTVSGFTLHGLNRYKPVSPNQKGTLVLTYFFKDGEEAYLVDPGTPNHISEEYTIVGVPSQGAYTPRLYSYPYWTTASGWRLKHYLCDLTRKFVTDVTQYVRVNSASPAFSGNAYGIEQPMIFNLTLSDVNASYSNWTFTQQAIFILYNDGTSTLRKWSVGHSTTDVPFQNLEVLYIPDTNASQTAKFGGGYADVDAFLAAAYTAMSPSFDPLTEENAPTPTHMALYRENGTKITLPVADYNKLALDGWTLINAETFYIAWIKRDASGEDYQLGVSAAITRKVSSF